MDRAYMYILRHIQPLQSGIVNFLYLHYAQSNF